MEATAAISCCRSDEAVSAAGGTTMLGVVCARGAVCGANQPSCGDEFASIALAASPYDCQAKVAPIPMENTMRKRARPREALPPSDGPIAPTDEPSIGSRPGRARSGWSAATSGWCAAFRKRPPTLASSPSTSVGWPMRSRRCATVKSRGNLGGVGLTVESIDSSTVSWLALTAMILWLEEGPIKAAPRPSRPATRRHGGTCSSDEEDQLRLDLMRQVRPQCGFNHAEDFRPTASASSSMLPASKITSLPSPRSAQPANAGPAHPSPCGKAPG